MLRSIDTFTGYPIEARDGEIGRLKDCLFDDRHWRLRYFVVDTRKWLPGKKVLISPLQAGNPEAGWSEKQFPVNLTKAQIKESPSLEEDAPVSTQYEDEFARYYKRIQPYWGGPYAWGVGTDPVYYPNINPEEMLSASEKQVHEFELKKIEHSHLRSAKEILGYQIETDDGTIGHVDDFLIDDTSWQLQYLVVDTKNWLPGKKSLIDIGWVDSIDWGEQKARVSLTRQQIEEAPDYQGVEATDHDYVQKLDEHYGKTNHAGAETISPLPQS